MLVVVAIVLNDFGWYTGSHAIGRNVVRNNAVSANDCTIANGYSREHTHIVAQPDVVANDYRTFGHNVALCGWNGQTVEVA